MEAKSPATPPESRREIAGLALVVAASFAIYTGTLRGFFVQDDFGWLESSRFTSVAEYARSFFRFNPSMTYRPLSQETLFWLGQKVFGLWPAGFHWVSLLLHLTGTAAVYLLLRLFCPVAPALVGALFYGAHPAHVWSVYWISAAPEPMALIFFVAAVTMFIRFDHTGDRRLWAAAFVAMGLGMLSKESILSLPLVLAAYSIIFSPRRLVFTLPFFALSGVYAVLRMTSAAVGAAPYPLTFGLPALRNLGRFACWTLFACQSTSFSRPLVAGTVALLVASYALIRNRRLALFGLAWYVAALQPVLYFPEHAYAYYLAPALPAAALVLAGVVLPDLARLARWGVWLAPLGLAGLVVVVSQPIVRREGRWWNDRTFQARSFIRQMRVIDARVPDDRTVFVIGMSPEDRGVLQEDAALKAYGFSMRKYILVGIDERMPGHIRHLAETRELKDFYCYVYFEGALLDWTDLFRRDPETVLLLNEGYLQRPDVRLEVDRVEVKRGRDTLRVRVVGLDVPAIDVLYTIDDELMPPLRDWALGPGGTLVAAVGAETRHGLYRYKAIRDSASRGPDSWILVEVQVWVD